MSAPLTHAGRGMRNRRDFLNWGGTGRSGIALTTLLAEQGLLASEAGPIRLQFHGYPVKFRNIRITPVK